MKHKLKRNLICSIVLLLGASGILGLVQKPAPLTVWGTGSLLGSKAHFESIQASKVLQDLLDLATGESRTPTNSLAHSIGVEAGQRGKVEAVVIFVSSREIEPPAASHINDVSGGSWLQFPNAVHQGQSNHVFKGVQQAASRINLQVLGSCTGTPAVLPATVESIQQALAAASSSSSGPAVVVVCADDSPEDERKLLSEAQAAVAALTDSFLMVHTTSCTVEGAKAEQRRRLLQAEDESQYTCDARCQTQVRFLEGLIIFITAALALGVGFCCMHGITTPTRFETPKEHRGGQHHE